MGRDPDIAKAHTLKLGSQINSGNQGLNHARVEIPEKHIFFSAVKSLEAVFKIGLTESDVVYDYCGQRASTPQQPVMEFSFQCGSPGNLYRKTGTDKGKSGNYIHRS
jgi:hypothetical protein